MLRSSCARTELLFWDARAGGVVADRGAMRHVAWASTTVPLIWAAGGVFPKMSDGSDVNAVHASPDGSLLATVDDFRKLNLFAFPCAGPRAAGCRSAAAHAAHVGSVRITADGRHAITVGGPDLCVLVWRIEG